MHKPERETLKQTMIQIVRNKLEFQSSSSKLADPSSDGAKDTKKVAVSPAF
jgi:hypothetical protein